MSRILQEDLRTVVAAAMFNWDKLAGKTVVVTGATGLIGGLTVRALALANELKGLKIRIVGMARHEVNVDGVESFVHDIGDPIRFDDNVDYIIHGASPTASKFFVEHPVETIRTAVAGTMNVMEFARAKDVSSVVYLSSMEMYGELPESDFRATEDKCGYLDPLAVRSSYPQSKRLCETLCVSYAKEYGVSVKIARLAQTVGAGVPKTDGRVFVQFAKSIVEGSDIVLHTDGSKAHCCVYTVDAVLGVLTVLLKGADAEAYNIANEETFASIRQIAEMAVRTRKNGDVRVVFDIPDNPNKFGYPKSSRLLVDSRKLRDLGWSPLYSLEKIFGRLVESLEER